MDNRRTLVAAIITAILLFIQGTILYAQDQARDTATVAEVVNGTTFKTADGRTIELLGLRLSRSKAITDADAKSHLQKLIGGKRVLLVRDTTLDDLSQPQGERLVIADGILVNVQMLRDGYAGINTSQEHSLRQQFTLAAAEARSMERGIWGRERARPVRCSYVDHLGKNCSQTTRNLSGRCYEHD